MYLRLAAALTLVVALAGCTTMAGTADDDVPALPESGWSLSKAAGFYLYHCERGNEAACAAASAHYAALAAGAVTHPDLLESDYGPGA